jgi:intracellular sulfur oxidation DsrE/DsrF family protein
MSGHIDGVVVHITSPDANDWGQALRNVSNLHSDESVPIEPNLITIVVNGEATRFLRADEPDADRLSRLADSGVRILACSSSLERLGYSPDELAEGVETVDSGVAEVTRLQWHGNGYLKLP